MEQIVYISTARVEPDAAMLESILAVSRRNNSRDGLTGLLVVGGRRFLQVLEGPGALCEAAYRRIGYDERHFAMVQLSRKPIDERAFGDWDMGFENAGDVPLTAMVGLLTERVSDPILQAHFRSFAELHSRAA